MNLQSFGVKNRYHWRRLDGDSFLFGKLNLDGEIEGEDCVYLFPGLERAISGRFKNGRMVSGKYGRVTGGQRSKVMMRPRVEVDSSEGDMTGYDPSTWCRIRYKISW